MMLETLGSLRKKFRQITSLEYGDCLLIPLEDFKPEWKNDMQKQGHHVIENMTHKNNEVKSYILIKMEFDGDLANASKNLPDAPPKTKQAIAPNANIAIVKQGTPKPPIPEPTYKRKHGHPPGNKKGLVHRGKMWTPALEQKLKEQMERRELIELPMPLRACKIQNQQPDLFPDRTTIALVQHYKKITTLKERVTAFFEAQKPETSKTPWQKVNIVTEQYVIEQDGMRCSASVIMENGVTSRISAVITVIGTDPPKEAVVIKGLPVDVIYMLHNLIEQLQEHKK